MTGVIRSSRRNNFKEVFTMLNTKELLFIHDCVAQGINHHEFPKDETASILD
jgi:hypothetical protein